MNDELTKLLNNFDNSCYHAGEHAGRGNNPAKLREMVKISQAHKFALIQAIENLTKG